jgi:hypothetical protein
MLYVLCPYINTPLQIVSTQIDQVSLTSSNVSTQTSLLNLFVELKPLANYVVNRVPYSLEEKNSINN